MTSSPTPPALPAPDRTVDARRMLCPMPLLKADGALREMEPGQLLAVLATDPGITRDLPAWCQVNGHQLLSLEQQGQEWRGLVRKG